MLCVIPMDPAMSAHRDGDEDENRGGGTRIID
ncbi:hypothetical protein C8D92_101413 [Tamilnaduibacter salinus]|uniref:Uncharacterized protein n=1 Tax=Tamilnaduibacter salinus TaxID=1484056 RepID=A0A2U1D1D2_9GAMM|nr:hypothetical protein C8D92_101413 [Tamilnaduibacter salinus]